MNIWFWIQAITFQAIWLISVLGGNTWAALTLPLLLLHFLLSPCPKKDFKILPLAIIGISLDMTLTQLGVFYFDKYPLWLLILWFSFVLNFSHSLTFLRKFKLMWQITLGAVGGCYAYVVSWKLGAVHFPLGVLTTSIILIICWSILLPILIHADHYLREYKK